MNKLQIEFNKRRALDRPINATERIMFLRPGLSGPNRRYEFGYVVPGVGILDDDYQFIAASLADLQGCFRFIRVFESHHEHVIKDLIGAPSKLPREFCGTFDIPYYGFIKVNGACNGKHRVTWVCDECGKEVSAGRRGQHLKVHRNKTVAVIRSQQNLENKESK